MDLKSLGSIQLKKIMRHMSHTSQIWFCLYYCITEIVDILATAVSNLKNCLLVEKKWGNLVGFEVYRVYTTQKNHETYVSQIKTHFCLTDCYMFYSNSFLELRKPILMVDNDMIMISMINGLLHSTWPFNCSKILQNGLNTP